MNTTKTILFGNIVNLKQEDLLDRHKGQPAIIAMHGPSLNEHKINIQELQRNDEIIRFSVNNWFDYFEEHPDYWVIANGEFTVQSAIQNTGIWSGRGYPKDTIHETDSTILFADSVDLSDYDILESSLKCDYHGYDQRHFKNRSCIDIIKSFKAHYEKNKDFDFREYGNNAQIWKPISESEIQRVGCNPVYGKFGAAFSGIYNNAKCCDRIDKDRLTVQEYLQEISGMEQHYGTADTVAFHAIAFAIIMGCNPIYIAGMDLDYNKGYAQAQASTESFLNQGSLGHWELLKNNIKNDLTILNNSAIIRDIEIINLLNKSWYGVLSEGEIL